MDFFSAILGSTFMPAVRRIRRWFEITYRPVLIVLSLCGILLAACLFFEGRFSNFTFPGLSFSLFLKCSLLCVTIVTFIGVLRIIKSIRQFEFDPLTGLKNMSEDVFPRLIQLNSSCTKGISLALFDVDNFKRINDKFGRPIADKLLQNMAISLGNSCRKKQSNLHRFSRLESSGFSKDREHPDELYRYYFRRGDEFLLVLVNSTLNDSISKAIPRILKNYYGTFKNSGGLTIDSRRVPCMVLSCGVIQIEKGDTVESIQERLDIALRKAKETKNRICGYDNGHYIVNENIFLANEKC